MNRRKVRQRLPVGLAVGIVGGMLLTAALPAAASPAAATAPGVSAATAQECTIDSAELRWGVKERFRNYISGSIANGEWITSEGAIYETPAFVWPAGSGTVSDDLSSGLVEFPGEIHFTGHGGAMQLDLQDPQILFTSPTSARLVVDMGSVDTEGTQLALQPVVAAEVDLAGAAIADGTSYTIANAPVRLTAAGAEAFNGEYGDYATGEPLDALALSMSVSGCTMNASTGTAAPPEEEPERPTSANEMREIPWGLVAVAGVALLAVVVATVLLVSGRKREDSESGETGEPDTSER